jgi:hypothetical protein
VGELNRFVLVGGGAVLCPRASSGSRLKSLLSGEVTVLTQPAEERDRPADLDTEVVWPHAPLIVGLLALIPAALTLAAASVPGFSISSAVMADALWAFLALGWVAAILVSRRPRKDRGGPREPWSWAIAPAVLLLTGVVAASGLPLNVRFGLSRSAFEQLPNRGLSYDAGASAGLYEVCCFERTDFGYQFGVSEGLNVVWGFAFSPDGAPPGPDIDSGGVISLQEGENAYRHLDGPWYIWEFAFT